jgi:hypothetical protein
MCKGVVLVAHYYHAALAVPFLDGLIPYRASSDGTSRPETSSRFRLDLVARKADP